MMLKKHFIYKKISINQYIQFYIKSWNLMLGEYLLLQILIKFWILTKEELENILNTLWININYDENWEDIINEIYQLR